MSISFAGIAIEANEISVSISGNIEVESHPWLLRDGALAARTSTGHKSVEVETLTGVRVLMQDNTGTYHDVPKNNDEVALTSSIIYEVTVVSLTATGADISCADGLTSAYATSMKYYGDRKILLARINDQNISYDKKKVLLDELNAMDADGTLSCALPGFSLSNCQFAESNGLNVASWTNGPYCDIKAVLVSRKKITLI